ncbi:hypothetical protein CHH83_02365 [Bacillus sp. 7586-K]|nr:hypothetical protein CHH83_02365 [Bacillus sp. 7586-K]
MIQNKVLKFGYGTIVVTSSDFFRTVEFKYIHPPKPIGEIKEKDLNEIVILDKVVFKYDSDMNLFYKELLNVTPENSILNFRGYTFDFTNYNEESLKVVIKGFKTAVMGFLLALAC